MNLINILKKGFISTIESLIIFSLLIILNPYSYSQTEQVEFLIGGYCASMHDPYQDSIYVMNYDQILECGLNSVWQKVKWTSPKRNLELLSPFKFIYTANDTAPQHTPIEGNKDWLSYFTHAKYFRWEAEGDDNFPEPPPAYNYVVGIKHNSVGHITNELDAWSSGTNASDIGKYFIDGPDYTQYKRHVYTNRQLQNPAIQYNTVFRLKLGSPQSGSFDVAKILVTVYNTETHQEIELPNSRIIKSDQLSSTAYTNFTIIYNYSTFLENVPNNNNYPPPPSAANWTPLMESDTTPWLDFSKKVRFKVQKLSTAEVIVDYIEVYDQEIWENYFILQPQIVVSKITNYVQQFSALGDKLKYYGTIDEPHTWDSFIPIKRIQEILDEHCAGKELLVHFYPEWNNRKEGVTLLDKWVNIAQPKKLMFWYFPFSCWNGTTEYCDPNPIEKTLYDLRNDLQKSHLLKPQFFVTLQSSGIYDSITQDYWKYYTPTPAAISAETMLSLAHGSLGIFYEPYYSYKSGDTRKIEALVDYPENNFAITDNWLKVQSIASRLKRTFGQTLLKLNYIATEDDNGYLRLARGLDSWAPETPTTNSLYYLTLSTTTQNPTPSPYNFHTGFFDRDEQPENNYFLLTNLLTTESKWVSVSIANNFSNCTNIRFRNIEPNYNFDMTFSGQTTQSFNFPAGEGYLFQVAPVVKYGGKLVYNETVLGGTTLTDDMSIESGATHFMLLATTTLTQTSQ